MGGKNITRVNKTVLSWESKWITEIARGSRKNVFVRVRKMSVHDIMSSIMARKGLTAAMEIRNYSRESGKDEISKQAWLKARRNLNPEVFRYVNDEYMKSFYESEDEVKLWHGYLVLAIDGSKAEIPNSEENRKTYGTQGNIYCEGPARALISGLFDVLNDFFLDLQICNVSVNELAAAKENINAIERIGLKQKVLIIFDRGYPSLELLNYLGEREIDYIVRIPSTFCKNERKQTESNDAVVKILNTKTKLKKLKAKNEDLYEKIRDNEFTATRLIRDKTPTGDEFAILTSLPDDIKSEEIISAYFLRWKIEEAYGSLKNKMKFESVTGNASIYVEQDFLAQVYVYNIMEDLSHAAEEKIQKEPDKYMYPQRINQNVAIGIFKDEFLDMALEENDRIRIQKLKRIKAEISKYTLPVRKSKSKKRQFNKANKFSCNLKPSF